MHLVTFILFYLVSVCFGLGNEKNCFTHGECKESYQLVGEIVEDQYACRKMCQRYLTCTWFTYYQKTSYCQLFKYCEFVDDKSCSDCLSGEKDCAEPGLKCQMVGKCSSQPLFTTNSSHVEDCLETCRNTSECKWWTFEADSEVCNFYSECQALSGCNDCTTNNYACVLKAEESEWHLILGGAGSTNTAELYNWRSGQQCQLPDLPVGVFGHVAAFMQDTPVFCEAGTSRRRCYKMDKDSLKWVSISSLLHGVEFGKSVYVPSQGWVVYGRLGNNFDRSQVLASLDGEWKAGPKLIDGGNNDSQCVFQLNDVETVFYDIVEEAQNQNYNHYYGRYNKYKTILQVFDWSIMTYTSYTLHEQDFNQNYNQIYNIDPSIKKMFPSCAKLQTSEGNYLSLATTRGIPFNGLEVIDLTTSSQYTRKEIAKLPGPGDNAGQPFTQLISINNGTELLLYGGLTGDVILNGIWQFSFATRKWIKVGQMLNPRAGHTVTPVQGLRCPFT